MAGLAHVPVLLPEVLERLGPHPGDRCLDGTIGAGGHAEALLERTGPDGQLLGLDADPSALVIAGERLQRFGDRVQLAHANFSALGETAREKGMVPAQCILLDLGLSSMQLNDPDRGFSFTSESLDMRADPTQGQTAADLVNEMDEVELANLIYRLGEEPRSRRIARAVVSARPLRTGKDLADVIENAVGRHSRIHPATRTFQALRMVVNREMENLEAVLAQLPDLLTPGGRVAIITFHSLEDRMVKYALRGQQKYRVLTKHPVQAEREEERANPRARSAKLRVAERI